MSRVWADERCGQISAPLFDLSILPVSWDNPVRADPLLKIMRLISEDDLGLTSNVREEAEAYFYSLGFWIYIMLGMLVAPQLHSHSAPLHSTPLHSTPLHSTPSTPLHSTPLHSTKA